MFNRLISKSKQACKLTKSLYHQSNNHILSSSDMLAEVTTFCVEFSRIREANSLYKLLKSLDNNN